MRMQLADTRAAAASQRRDTSPSKTTWKGKAGRIDVENPAPGKRPGQIHYQDPHGNKYLYDLETGQFPDAPPSVNKLLKNMKFRKGIEKGRKYLGE